MQYPATFTPDTGGFVVTFRDIPEAITQGDDEAEAMAMALDVLPFAIESYFDEKRAVPPPSKPLPGERLVDLPLSVSAKVLLLNEMLAQAIRPAELARRMNTKPQEINRLLDLHHRTKIDTIWQAMAALGKRLDFKVA
jgi:antitoxin HicB